MLEEHLRQERLRSFQQLKAMGDRTPTYYAFHMGQLAQVAKPLKLEDWQTLCILKVHLTTSNTKPDKYIRKT